MAFGDSLPKNIDNVPWELKQQLLGLRGAEWAPIALNYGAEKWGVQSAPSPYVATVFSLENPFLHRLTFLLLNSAATTTLSSSGLRCGRIGKIA